jgi:hypothetical protein
MIQQTKHFKLLKIKIPSSCKSNARNKTTNQTSQIYIITGSNNLENKK